MGCLLMLYPVSRAVLHAEWGFSKYLLDGVKWCCLFKRLQLKPVWGMPHLPFLWVVWD